MTHAQSRELLRFILAAWTTQQQRATSESLVAMDAAYAAGLADVDYELAKGAVGRLVRTSRWLPTVAEIREAAGVLVHGQQKTGAEAWGAVTRAIRERGSHRQPGVDFVFNDPITRSVVSALNWRELCASNNGTADRARFIDAYEQAAKNERTEAQANDGAVSRVLPFARDGEGKSIGELAMKRLTEMVDE